MTDSGADPSLGRTPRVRPKHKCEERGAADARAAPGTARHAQHLRAGLLERAASVSLRCRRGVLGPTDGWPMQKGLTRASMANEGHTEEQSQPHWTTDEGRTLCAEQDRTNTKDQGNSAEGTQAWRRHEACATARQQNSLTRTSVVAECAGKCAATKGMRFAGSARQWLAARVCLPRACRLQATQKRKTLVQILAKTCVAGARLQLNDGKQHAAEKEAARKPT
ncbi:hypothetical protein ERJ75_001105500 [Trypanosoma vivax]|nr:hypothetical protein ERJ75_001105500 [Trypanosoma vivax]